MQMMFHTHHAASVRRCSSRRANCLGATITEAAPYALSRPLPAPAPKRQYTFYARASTWVTTNLLRRLHFRTSFSSMPSLNFAQLFIKLYIEEKGAPWNFDD